MSQIKRIFFSLIQILFKGNQTAPHLKYYKYKWSQTLMYCQTYIVHLSKAPQAVLKYWRFIRSIHSLEASGLQAYRGEARGNTVNLDTYFSYFPNFHQIKIIWCWLIYHHRIQSTQIPMISYSCSSWHTAVCPEST